VTLIGANKLIKVNLIKYLIKVGDVAQLVEHENMHDSRYFASPILFILHFFVSLRMHSIGCFLW
jgi:hypothetical protein